VSPIQRLVLRFDAHLRRRAGVFEYSDSPRCVFRIGRAISRCGYTLSDGVAVSPGDKVVELHLWNEHMPRMAAARASIGWGSRLAHGFRFSLQELCAWLDSQPEYDDVVAVRTDMALAGGKRTEQLVRRMCMPFGLEEVNDGHRPPLGERLFNLGENVTGLLLVLATNPAAVRPDILLRGRARLAMSRAELRRRHGARTDPGLADHAIGMRSSV
jgi:hypothetical protein